MSLILRLPTWYCLVDSIRWSPMWTIHFGDFYIILLEKCEIEFVDMSHVAPLHANILSLPKLKSLFIQDTLSSGFGHKRITLKSITQCFVGLLTATCLVYFYPITSTINLILIDGGDRVCDEFLVGWRRFKNNEF